MEFEELKTEIKKYFNFNNIIDSLPAIGLVAGGVLFLEKILGIGEKLKPAYDVVKQYNKEQFFELIDTIADNLEFIDMKLKVFNLDAGDVIKKIGDFLQKIGVAGKYIGQFTNVLPNNLSGLLSNKGKSNQTL